MIGIQRSAFPPNLFLFLLPLSLSLHPLSFLWHWGNHYYSWHDFYSWGSVVMQVSKYTTYSIYVYSKDDPEAMIASFGQLTWDFCWLQLHNFQYNFLTELKSPVEAEQWQKGKDHPQSDLIIFGPCGEMSHKLGWAIDFCHWTEENQSVTDRQKQDSKRPSMQTKNFISDCMNHLTTRKFPFNIPQRLHLCLSLHMHIHVHACVSVCRLALCLANYVLVLEPSPCAWPLPPSSP